MSEIDPEIAERLKRHADGVALSPDLPDRIVHRVRSHRRRRRLGLVALPAATVLALVIAVSGLLHAQSRVTTTRAAAGSAAHGAARATGTPSSAVGAAAGGVVLMPTSVLAPTGVGRVRFGEAQTQAIAQLQGILGRPQSAHPQPDPSCDVTESLAWRGFSAYFDHARFVGYSTTRQSLTTARGLHSGSTVSAARAIYGSGFHLSTAQGGSYRITLSSGVLTGYLGGGVTATSIAATAHLDGIFAGATGCPGITP